MIEKKRHAGNLVRTLTLGTVARVVGVESPI